MGRVKKSATRRSRVRVANGNSRKEKTTVEVDVYGENWRNISYKAKQKIKICCFCLIKKSEETHHVKYRNSSKKLLLDKVTLGLDIFPVDKECHELLHTSKYWKTYKDASYNQNTEDVIKRLQFGYLVLNNERFFYES